MIEQACGTCRHWGDEGSVERFRTCEAVIHDVDGKHASLALDSGWELDAAELAEIEAMRKHLAVVVDGSGYHAALKCREDFGCRLWQDKPTTSGGG